LELDLDLETSRPPTSTGFLKLATLGLDVWFLVLVWSHAEMLDGLSGVLRSSKEESVASSRGSQRKLVQSQSLTSSSKDARTSSGSESESSHAELRNGQETVVIGDGTDNDDGLVVRLLGGVPDNSGD